MIATLARCFDNKEETMGILFIDGVYACFTLEDQKQQTKVMHETRIPPGLYAVKLRTHGSHHERYKQKFAFHEGMFELESVPGFTDILIHIGNTDADTSGCILVGNGVTIDNTTKRVKLQESTVAYERIYKAMVGEARGSTLQLLVSDTPFA
jgi:hypothetical protein